MINHETSLRYDFFTFSKIVFVQNKRSLFIFIIEKQLGPLFDIFKKKFYKIFLKSKKNKNQQKNKTKKIL